MIAVALAMWLGGCSSTCGSTSEVFIEEGAYLQPVSTTASTSASTPFASAPTPDVAGLEVAGDVVTVSYVDDQGREVVATYHVVESSLTR